jgi:hypothetical protein
VLDHPVGRDVTALVDVDELLAQVHIIVCPTTSLD